MKSLFITWFLLTLSTPLSLAAETSSFDERRADWRNGAITYQVFVDRFAPTTNLEAKAKLYSAPKSLRPWSELPKREKPAEDSILWTHELAFWGGDLKSLSGKIDYLKELGIDALYLNPIVEAQSNHKYDAIDYYKIAPEYGNFEDLKNLSSQLHNNNMRLILDGVFNHIGFQSHWFQDALNNHNSRYRDWFLFDKTITNGYVGWWGVANLPEFDWSNSEILNEIVTKPESVIRHYFDYGIDGWRLDVAFEMSPQALKAISDVSHQEKPGSLVIGEVWNYPKDWTNSLDAVMNFTLRELMFNFAKGQLSGDVFTKQIHQMVKDTGIEAILRSWLLLDNHDTKRLMTLYPDQDQRRLLQALQMTLPGAPLIYYGVELGMEGGEDPENRAPMRWDLLQPDNEAFKYLTHLIALRQSHPALKVGNYTPLISNQALAFLRTTDRIDETIVVVANNSNKSISETLMLQDPRIMNGEEFVDLLSGRIYPSRSAILKLNIPSQTVMILKPKMWPDHTKRTGHSAYKHLDVYK